MNIMILGAGMMGHAIAYDLCKYSQFEKIIIVDKDKKNLQSAEKFLGNNQVEFLEIDVKNTSKMKEYFKNVDIAISALPYTFNYALAELAVETQTHFLDLGGNNDIVNREKSLCEKAKKMNVTLIPDCGLAPGLVSIITRDIVENFDLVEIVKLRVGGLPLIPKPPLNYQIVFSLDGLLNEYIEDALVLDHGRIIKKKSMTEIEEIIFPKPFGKMEAFLTSGGCSTLPYTYKNNIRYLDYKTVRYPGHCEKFRMLLDLGLGETTPVIMRSGEKIIPREVLITLLEKHLSTSGPDVVLLKVTGTGMKKGTRVHCEYMMIDYFDESTGLSAMMRTTGFPVSITAQMIEQNVISQPGVYCPEEIVPPQFFFKELEKRNIVITKKYGEEDHESE